MNQGSMCCKLYFESPFWVLVIEWKEDERLSVSRTVFPIEPSNQEVLAFLNTKFSSLCFQTVNVEDAPSNGIHHKRMIRIVQKQMKQPLLSTKSQAALKQQMEARAKQRKAENKQNKEQKETMQFQKRQQKRKKKHRGR